MAKAIKANSLLFRYYMFIRWMWGYDEKPQEIGLCPYVQTMFWGSIFIVVFSWALILGWICMKVGRIACKFKNPYTDEVIRYLEQRTLWLNKLDTGPKDFAASPMITAISFCIMGGSMLFITLAALFLLAGLVGAIGLGLWNIVDVGAAILYTVAWCFTQLFMVLYWFGFGLDRTYAGAVWLFTNGAFWYNILSWTSYILAWILGVGIASVSLCLVCIAVVKLSFVKGFGRYLTSRFNGFAEAQKERRVRGAEKRAAEERMLPTWKCSYCNYNNNPGSFRRCEECRQDKQSPVPMWYSAIAICLRPLGWLLDRGVSVRTKIGNREIDVVGPLGILWSYIVGLKKGMCPIYEIVDPAEMQAQAQASAKERMEREEEESTEKVT